MGETRRARLVERMRNSYHGGTPKYGATMSRDGEVWDCKYDVMYGAGFDDVY